MREQPVDTIEYRGFDINIYQDIDAENPREWDNIGKMLCKHRDYCLGDAVGHKRGNNPGADYPRDAEEIVEEMLAAATNENKAAQIRQAWEYGQGNSKKFSGFVEVGLYICGHLLPIIIPLYLYDHSGISMSAGSNGTSFNRRGHNAFDPGGWDTSSVGFIFCTHEDVKREYGVGPDKEGVEPMERAERYLRGEVEVYSQYLEGSVYGYSIEPKDNNKAIECDDSCWGFYGYDWKENNLEDMAKWSIDSAIEKYRQSVRKLHVEKMQTRKFLAECWAD